MVRARWTLVVGMLTGVLAIAFESSAVSTAMPEAAAQLDGLGLYAWVFSLFTIAMLFATVLGGRVADSRGAVPPLVVGLGLFAAGLVVAGSAPTMLVLLAGRLLQGLGAGAMNVGFAVLTVHAFAAAERPRLMSLVSTTWVVPALLGPPVAAAITRVWGWHWVFYSVLPLAAVSAVLGGLSLARLPRGALVGDGEPGQPVSVSAALLVSLATAGLQWTGQQASVPGRSWLVVGGVLAVSAAGLVLLLPRLMPLPPYDGPAAALRPTIVARAAISGAFLGGSAFFPLLMVQLFGWDLLGAGIILAVGAVGWTTGAWVQARVSLRRDQLVLAGAAAVTAGLALLVLVPLLHIAWLAFAGWVVAGFGMGLAVASTSLVVMAVSAPRQQGRNNAALQVADSLGNSLLVGVAGTIHAALAGLSLTTAYVTLLVAMAACGLSAVVAARRIGLVGEGEPAPA